MNKKSDEIVQAIAAIHAAHTNALVVLGKTLQEAGVLDPTHYTANIRTTIEANNSRIGPDVQRLLVDLAELMEMQDEVGTA
ncbi:hypothetical protein [Sinorhizobium sp. RAC02]|uniref:hypothetical protein n=1 Tax=Sinorhizobium sp. RAC02 TaxID=1842534 RepID=UPI00083CCF04|nr:hypothetical protein [Sinorhizobium sp. RAC02]AOF91006.1 hypothetical protein BSY16_2310 [Sinorhizobium sp. RAC02]